MRSPFPYSQRHRTGSFIVLAAISAIQIAASYGHDLSRYRMRTRLYRAHKHPSLAEFQVNLSGRLHSLQGVTDLQRNASHARQERTAPVLQME
jgi:hypothetical protein